MNKREREYVDVLVYSINPVIVQVPNLNSPDKPEPYVYQKLKGHLIASLQKTKKIEKGDVIRLSLNGAEFLYKQLDLFKE